MNELVIHLNKEKQRLLGLIGSIDNLLKEYSQNDPAPILEQNHSDVNDSEVAPVIQPLNANRKIKKGFSLKESVKNAVLGLERFDKGSNLMPALLQLYPDKINNQLNFRVQVSGLLSDLRNDGNIVKFQFSPSKKDTVWGKPEWLDVNGRPKPGFEPILK